MSLQGMSAANDEAILLNKGSIGIPLFNEIAASPTFVGSSQ
jgi:hypothetical protein